MPGRSSSVIFPSTIFTPSNRSLDISRFPSRSAQWANGDSCAAAEMALHQELIKLCGEPDLTVLLKASVSTRMSRIHNRNGQDKDLSNCAMYDDGYDKMEQFLKNSGFNYIVIDTEHLSPEEIADIVIKNIDLNKQKKLIKERK